MIIATDNSFCPPCTGVQLFPWNDREYSEFASTVQTLRLSSVCRSMFELIRQRGGLQSGGGGPAWTLGGFENPPKERKIRPPSSIVCPNMWTYNHHQCFAIFRGPFLLSSAPANGGQSSFPTRVRCRGWNICERRSFTLSDNDWSLNRSVFCVGMIPLKPRILCELQILSSRINNWFW